MSHVDKPAAEPTVGRLVADASRDVSALVQSEIALAKSELKVSARAGGVGAALLIAAAFFAMMIVIFLSLTVVYFIVMAGLGPAWAFLIVTFFYVIVAAIVAVVGIKKLKAVRAPEKTIATAKKIPPALKGKTSRTALSR